AERDAEVRKVQHGRRRLLLRGGGGELRGRRELGRREMLFDGGDVHGRRGPRRTQDDDHTRDAGSLQLVLDGVRHRKLLIVLFPPRFQRTDQLARGRRQQARDRQRGQIRQAGRRLPLRRKTVLASTVLPAST